MTSATFSHATGSSSSPPSTACSDSTECGGTGASSSAAEPGSPRALAETATVIARPGALLFRDDGDVQRHVDVGVQVQAHQVLADEAQRARGQAHLAALDAEPLACAGFRDVGRADRAVELALGAGLGMNRELEVLYGRGALFGRAQVLARQALELGAARLEARGVIRGRQCRLALRQQEVASVARAHLHP